MPAKDLGGKYVCFKCSTKFYDLKKPDPVCPKCGADQRDSPALRPAPEGKRGRVAAIPKPIEPVEVEETTPEVVEEEEAEETFEEEPADAAEEEEI